MPFLSCTLLVKGDNSFWIYHCLLRPRLANFLVVVEQNTNIGSKDAHPWLSNCWSHDYCRNKFIWNFDCRLVLVYNLGRNLIGFVFFSFVEWLVDVCLTRRGMINLCHQNCYWSLLLCRLLLSWEKVIFKSFFQLLLFSKLEFLVNNLPHSNFIKPILLLLYDSTCNKLCVYIMHNHSVHLLFAIDMDDIHTYKNQIYKYHNACWDGTSQI